MISSEHNIFKLICFLTFGPFCLTLRTEVIDSHQGDPSSIPGQGNIKCESSCALVLCCATGVFQTTGFPPSGKIEHFRSLAVLRGHNGLMWLAAKSALVCLLLKHVVAASFAIQLLVRMISPQSYYYYYCYMSELQFGGSKPSTVL